MVVKKLKILIGKAGLDGHDRGVKVVARALKEAGFEVVYTGVHLTPEMIVDKAVKENVDVIGISILSGAHIHVFEEIFGYMKLNKIEEIPVFGGGVIPEDDIDTLHRMGVKKIFFQGARLDEIVSWIESNIRPRVAR